jgi:hypothetical protein
MKPQTIILLLLALATLSGCETMSVTNEWKDPAWAGPPAHSVLVIGVAQNPGTRRVFEDTFAQQLNANGVQGIPSYTVLGSSADSNQLREAVQKTGAQALMITRVQKIQQKVDVSPGYYGGFYGWYGGAWASTPMVSQYEQVTLETSVWSTSNEKLIWSTTTQNIGTSDIPGKTASLAQTLIPKLKADNVIR